MIVCFCFVRFLSDLMNQINFPEYPLLNIRTDDNFMARFLCGNYKVTTPEKAAEKIFALYKFRVSFSVHFC